MKMVLQKLALAKVGKVSKSDELDAFEQDWDNLIIIDACRQDYWEEETGMEGSRVSKASKTPEFIEKNFSEGDFSDFVYISGNPQFSDVRFEELTGRLPEDTFHSIFKTFNDSWDDEKNTVLPEDTIRDALTAQKLFPDKRIVVHILPPHYPFIRKPVSKGGISQGLEGRDDSAWNLAEAGEVSHEEVEEGYRDNMRYVEDHVRELGKKLDGKTILTSDHGNLVGEAGIYGHPRDKMEKPLKVVPWVRLDNKE